MELFPIVFEQGGRAVTTSREVADYFGKAHRNVLRDINNTIEQLSLSPEGKEFSRLNFELAEYRDEQGKPRPLYILTRDGFTLLVMGFTGAEALKFKISYINAFNRMSDMIKTVNTAITGGMCDPELLPEPIEGEDEISIFLKAIARATQSGEYVIVSQYAKKWQGKLLGVYTGEHIRLYATLAYKLYCSLSEKPLSRPKLYRALEDKGLAEPHKGTPRAIKGTHRAAIFLYRRNKRALSGIRIIKK